MARVKGAMMTRKRRNATLKLAKSYWGSKSKHFKMAKQAVMKSGKVKRARAYKSHILTKKDTKRTRRLRTTAYADVTNTAAVKKMIPYK